MEREANRVNAKESQKDIIKTYAEHVNKPKANFFKDIGLGVVQGKREGIYIWTLEGKRKNEAPVQLIDCRTAGGTFNLGHRHPAVLAAMREALDAGLDVGDHHMISQQRALLAKKMAGLLPPGITKTQFCSAGGEAVDLAIKLARGITKRKKVVSAIGAYHGVTGVALAAGSPKFKSPFSWDLPDFTQVPFGDVLAIEQALDDRVACVIFETIPATGGILIAPEGYFARVRELCDAHGIVMIADEVQAGLGRTGDMWAIYGGLYENEKVIPDIIVLAKGMSGGIYPMSTCSYKPYIEAVFEQDPFLHISTTGGSELGCYVCGKMLDLLSAPEFLGHVKQMGVKLGKALVDLGRKHDVLVTDVRGRGLMWGIEFINDKYGLGYTLKMIENGIFADYCGNNEKVVKLMPPLVVRPDEIDLIVARLSTALDGLPHPKQQTGD